jgi:hypothetical protein
VDDPSTRFSVDYSSREVSPATLLIKQIERAHRVFLLHHGISLSELYQRLGRSKFCNILEKFWTYFAQTWDVLLHGSPAVDIFGGIKLAAGGELGIGVGEEEWGSGEREVLEDFVSRTEGLVDVVVSRFGEPSSTQQFDRNTPKEDKQRQSKGQEPWLGTGKSPAASDGVIFSGNGTLSKASVRNVAYWMQWIYTHGEFAYGVKENPGSNRRGRRKKLHVRRSSPASSSKAKGSEDRPTIKSSSSGSRPAGIPPPIVSAAEHSFDNASKAVESHRNEDTDLSRSPFTNPDKWMKVLTLGYGSAWGAGTTKTSDSDDRTEDKIKNHEGIKVPEVNPKLRYIDPKPDIDHVQAMMEIQAEQENHGYFLIGLKGDMEQADVENPDEGSDGDDWNSRILLRTVHVECTKEIEPGTPGSLSEEPAEYQLTLNPVKPKKPHQRVRAIVYVVCRLKLINSSTLVTDSYSTDRLFIPFSSKLVPPP